MKKAVLKLFGVALLLVTAFAGCTRKSGTGGASGAMPDKLSLSIERPIFTSSPKGTLVETTWLKALEAYMGLPLELDIRESGLGDYGERLSVYLASGDWADIFLTTNGTTSIYELGQDGMLLNLRDYPGQTKNFFALAQGNELKRITAPDGGIYGFSDLLISTYNGTQETIQVNVEVFEKHNINIPETLEELYNAAKQLKALYPDSFPISGTPGLLHQAIFLAYGERRGGVYYNGQEYVYGPRQPGYKKGLEFLHKLYAEKLLDPEYFTQAVVTPLTLGGLRR
jgi:putative aldouronate transport system substrate-binding protein